MNDHVHINGDEELAAPDSISVSLIRLLDGTMIDPATREPIVSPLASGDANENESENKDEYTPPPVSPIELDIVAQDRKSIMDLTLTPRQLAMVNNVLVLTLWGMPEDEIATCSNCSVEQVQQIRGLDEYASMKQALTIGLYAAVSETVQGKLTLASLTATDRVVETLNSKSGDLRLNAAKDVLDRSGFRPADRVEHVHSIGNDAELTIRVTRDSDKDDIPTIDMEPV